MTRLRPRHGSLATVLGIGFLLANAACGGAATEGADGRASFSYGSFGQSLAQPMAAGASTTMSVTSQSPVATVASSDPAILTVGPLTSSNATNYSFSLAAVKPGSATLTLYGPDNTEVDHTTVVVAPVTAIALDSGVASDVTVLAGDDTFSVHATVEWSGGVLVGDGSVRFGYEGALFGATDAGPCIGDCGGFSAPAPGDGQVILSTSTVTTTLVVHVIDASAVDEIDFEPSSLDLSLGGTFVGAWPYTLSAGGTPVHGTGLQCVSSDASIAVVGIFQSDPALGSGATGSVGISAEAAGSATITCSMNAATPHTWTIPVTVH